MTTIFLDGVNVTTSRVSVDGEKKIRITATDGFDPIDADLDQREAWKLIRALRDFAGDEPQPTLEELVRALAPGTVFEIGASRFGAIDDNRRVRLSGDDYLDAGKNIQPISLLSGEQGTVKIIHPKEES